MSDNEAEQQSKKRKTTSSTTAEDNTTTTPNTKKSKQPVVVPTYEERCLAVNAISYPLANKKMTKKCHKLVRKASSMKILRRGVKEVIKGLRKNETDGIVILAGDIYPIDVIAHIPLLLEEKNVPYLFVPSKFDLGAAAATKRPTSCVFIRKPTTTKGTKTKSPAKDQKDTTKEDSHEEMMEMYNAILKEAKEYDPTKTIVLRE